jgi:hypothetical protein
MVILIIEGKSEHAVDWSAVIGVGEKRVDWSAAIGEGGSEPAVD